MTLMTIIYTNRMAESVTFYERLGLTRDGAGDVEQWWNQFLLGDAILALHWHQDQPLPNGANPELHLNVSADRLEPLFETCRQAGFEMASEITQLDGMETRTFFVVDPNGLKVFING